MQHRDPKERREEEEEEPPRRHVRRSLNRGDGRQTQVEKAMRFLRDFGSDITDLTYGVSDFVVDIDECVFLYNLEDSEVRHIVRAKSKGPVATFFRLHCLPYYNRLAWVIDEDLEEGSVNLRSMLLERFKVKTSPHKIEAELASCTKGKNSAREYADKLIDIGNQLDIAYEGSASSELINQKLFHQFKAGVDEASNTVISSHRCKTLEDAVKAVEILEASRPSKRFNVFAATQGHVQDNAEVNNSSTVTSIQQHDERPLMREQEPFWKTVQRPVPTDKVRCSICKIFNHIARNCPTRDVKCTLCNIKGHHSNRCITPPQERLCGRCFEVGHSLRFCNAALPKQQQQNINSYNTNARQPFRKNGPFPRTRTTKHKTTGKSPYEVMFCRKANLPLASIFAANRLPFCDNDSDYSQEMAKRMQVAFDQVQEINQHTDHEVAKSHQFFNKNRKLRIFYPGDIVDKVIDFFPSGKRKLGKRFFGPFEILQRKGDVSYKIRNLQTGKTSTTHVNKLVKLANNNMFTSQITNTGSNKGDNDVTYLGAEDILSGQQGGDLSIDTSRVSRKINKSCVQLPTLNSKKVVEQFDDSSESEMSDHIEEPQPQGQQQGVIQQVVVPDRALGPQGERRYNLRRLPRHNYNE